MPDRLSTRSRSVAGTVVLVTGAASGMGRAVAHLFGDEGAKVAVTDLDRTRVEAVVEEIRGAGGTAHGWVLDVTDPDAVAAVVDEVRALLGPVGVLVNNAGIAAGAPLDDPDFDRVWAEALAVNVTAHQRLVRACHDDLVTTEGRVVNIASTEALGASRGIPAYTAAKHAVAGLTKAMALHFADTGVTANAVCPGPILTGMTEAIPAEARDRYARRRVPMRRYGDPEEVAHVVLCLALPSSSFVTGAVIPVDGGLTAKND